MRIGDRSEWGSTCKRSAMSIWWGKQCGTRGTIVDDSFDGRGEVRRSSRDYAELRDEFESLTLELTFRYDAM
jgi:hypothetical protein